MEWITMDEYVENRYGPLGTASREAFEEDMRQLEVEWQQTHWVGSSLKHMRQAQGLTQSELGHQADVRPSEISRIERGLMDGCSFETVVRLVKALGMRLTLQTPQGECLPLA